MFFETFRCFHINNVKYQQNLELFSYLFTEIDINILLCYNLHRILVHQFILNFKIFPLRFIYFEYIFFPFLVCYWTYYLNPTIKPEDRGLKNYCDPILVHTANWGCIVGIFFAVPGLCGGCAGLCYACCSS